MNKRILAVVGLIIVAIGAWAARGVIRDAYFELTKPDLPPAQEYQAPVATTTPAEPTPTSTNDTTKPEPPRPVLPPATSGTPSSTDPIAWSGNLPTEVNLDVPFLLQAPKQNWVQPFEDACEEASLIMVDAYYDGRRTDFGPDEGVKAILDLVAYEDAEYGYNKDTTTEDVAHTAEEYFGYPKAIIRDATEANIKAALANGYPVIVPAYGKALFNPNFRNGGPDYHMLVIKGYTKGGLWITNDPGTRRGPDYTYTNEVLMNALHEYNATDMRLGRAVMVVVLPR